MNDIENLELKDTILSNYKIEELIDKNKNKYYVIISRDEKNHETAYFCFSKMVRVGWDILATAFENKTMNEITIQFDENEREKKGVMQIFRRVITVVLNIEQTMDNKEKEGEEVENQNEVG
jgi:hypothetical protein